MAKDVKLFCLKDVKFMFLEDLTIKI